MYGGEWWVAAAWWMAGRTGIDEDPGGGGGARVPRENRQYFHPAKNRPDGGGSKTMQTSQPLTAPSSPRRDRGSFIDPTDERVPVGRTGTPEPHLRVLHTGTTTATSTTVTLTSPALYIARLLFVYTLSGLLMFLGRRRRRRRHVYTFQPANTCYMVFQKALFVFFPYLPLFLASETPCDIPTFTRTRARAHIPTLAYNVLPAYAYR